ncbi:hypothetical protein CC86DRAFT_404207 [Ophiobolus disseminans]|uniref:Uncharacterized protein n=1 Tax=Ophiobolus disseminans TaxID=1469910 RepID=A0A6A7A8S9_9PLEO|nr:hypothetical protein CC86DRAFT_404207 [Ophiobolus disseminans]
MRDFTTDIRDAVCQLKVERDTWQAVALQYKAAFTAQTHRLQELQDVCFATQAELENERIQQRRRQIESDQSHRNHPSKVDGAEDQTFPPSFGTAIVSPHERQRQTSDTCTNPLFHRVQQCIDQRNYGTALAEIERLLRGPLSPKARTEGLLLKSSILHAAGPDELYDALAACSEALELCDRIADLETFLPRIQYQRGVLYYQLHMLYQAREAFSAVSDDDSLSPIAKQYHRSCDDEIGMQRAGNRRSGFDEDRLFDEGLVVKLDEKIDIKRRRTSAQLRLRAAMVRSKRMPLPHRWARSKSDVV